MVTGIFETDVVFIGDIHLDKLTRILGSDAIDTQLYSVGKALKYALSKGIKNIVLLGDLCENVRFSIAAEVALIHLLRDYTEKGLEFHIILGNHDFAENGIHALSVLSTLTALKMLVGVSVYTCQEQVMIDGVPFNFCPYPSTKGKSRHINIGHFEVSGSTRDNGRKIAKAEVVKDSHYWVMGHLHTPHDVGNVHYVGTMYQTTFGEKLEKYFTVSNIKYDGVSLTVKHSRKSSVPPFELINLSVEHERDLDPLYSSRNDKSVMRFFKIFLRTDVELDDTLFSEFNNIIDIKGYETRDDLKALEDEEFLEITEQTLELPSLLDGVRQYFTASGCTDLFERAQHFLRLAKDG